MTLTSDVFLPVELVFNPNWWYTTAGIRFDEAFYLDASTRIRNDHCGDTLQRVAAEYAKLPLAYCEVGWGSDVALVREALPDVFLNLRLSPVRMLQCTPREIADDTEALLRAAGPLERTGLC